MEQQQLVSNNNSNSLLKSFDEHGPKALIRRINPYNKGIDFGSKLDDFISLTKEEFNKQYLIVQNGLTGDLFKLAEVLVKDVTINTHKLIIPNDKIIGIINAIAINAELFKRIKLDASRITKFNSNEFYEFVKFLDNHKEQTFITPDEYSKLIEAQSSLFNHKSTKSYFNLPDTCEEIYQLELNFMYKGRNMKGILDKVIINHTNMTIQPLDLKSGSFPAKDFMGSFFKFKYYMQGAIYNKAIKEWIKDSSFIGYTILPFKFIYLPTFDCNNPKTFILSEKWEQAAWDGFTTNSGYKYRGIDELVDEINWHIRHQVFNETRDFYENQEIMLDDSFIHLT